MNAAITDRPRRLAAFAAGVVAVGLAFAGCSEDLPRFGTLRYEGDDFEVWASDGLVACEGTYAYTEAWLGAFREALGSHARPQYHVFNWVDEGDLDAAPCSSPGACAFAKDNVIYSPQIPHEHEIVHVELDTNGSSPIFSEGAAEAFGSDQSLLDVSASPVEPLLEATTRISPDGYPTAGRFIRFLIETYGIDASFSIVRASRDEDGRSGIAKAFDAELGMDLESVVADFRGYPACATAAWRFRDYECSSLPPTPWQDEARWRVDVDLACDREDAIGPRHDLVWTIRSFDVAEAGEYSVSGGHEDVTVYLVPCDLSCIEQDDAGVVVFGKVDRWPVTLQAGRYWVRIEQDAGIATGISLSIER